jgi:hypothetical protein
MDYCFSQTELQTLTLVTTFSVCVPKSLIKIVGRLFGRFSTTLLRDFVEWNEFTVLALLVHAIPKINIC